MAFTPKKTEVVVVRREYFVPDDSTMKDLSDAMRHVSGSAEAAGLDASYDDVFRVRAADEGIVLYFETKEMSR